MKYRLSLRLIPTVLLLSLLLAACVMPETAPAAEQESAEMEQVTIGVGAQHAFVYLDFDVAHALGYFEEEVLDVDLQYFGGGSDAANALIGGSVDFSGNAIDHALKAQVKGEELMMVHNIMSSPCVTVIGRSDVESDIQSAADFAGRKVGITRLGSATHILAVYMAAQAGIPADDFEVVEVGGSTMPAAIEAQSIDVAVGVAPFTTRLIDAGDAYVISDLCDPAQAEAAIGGGLPFTGMLTREDIVTARPEAAQKVVNAMIRANQFITSHSAEEIADIMPESAVGDNRDVYIESLAANLSAFNQENGRINPDGLDILLKLHDTFGTFEEGTEIDLDALYSNSLQDASPYAEGN